MDCRTPASVVITDVSKTEMAALIWQPFLFWNALQRIVIIMPVETQNFASLQMYFTLINSFFHHLLHRDHLAAVHIFHNVNAGGVIRQVDLDG